MSRTRPTEAELAVLRALTEPGAGIKSVAHDLGITPRAAVARLHSLYGRLGVSTAAQAVVAAWELLDLPLTPSAWETEGAVTLWAISEPLADPA